MPPLAVVVEDLKKYFPPALSGWRTLLHPFARPTECALAGVSFAVEPGEAVALVGPNGAGKSTLLRILATLLVPTAGRAELAGFDVERDAARVRAKLGYHIGGDEGFYGRLTGRENLAFFGALNGGTGADGARAIVEVSATLGLSDILDRQVRTYSSGMRHRLGLARALLHRPSVLLLDEPTRSLDPIAAAEFRRYLKDETVRRQGTTLLFASHALSEVEELGDRVAILVAGKLHAFDSPRGLCAKAGVTTLEQAVTGLAGFAHQSESIS